jgi:hypothetical protein
MSIDIENLDPIPSDMTPYEFDAYNMGQNIGTNAMIMLSNFDSQLCKYVIVIDRTTGERIKLTFTAVEK